MGVKAKGVSQSKDRLDALLADVQGRKVVRAVQSALFIIGAEAAAMTPRDTSTLVNSQFRNLQFIGTRVNGRVGFSADYALYVHEASGKLKGKPRSSVKSFNTSDGRTAFASNQGNFWDPSGEPKFLDKAATRTRKQVEEVIKKELSL
ncbi:HK97 gp10 family phage protein [Cedecea neteri]|uniref:HK97 gp10 family phage protein n=1 Tax=Cedecea neteri TaxID=158822 RepID=UPI002892E537|nr:HK97 gp10 family phage protein [Cedecea neteri]WNJ77748.1 HK97 gp10 family phage protein [Cedecea neteri]